MKEIKTLSELSCYHFDYKIKAIKGKETLKIVEKYYPKGESIFWYENEKGEKISENEWEDSLLWNLLVLRKKGYKIYAKNTHFENSEWKEIL